MKKWLLVFLEFLIGGILLGICEDFILITLVTEESITLDIFLIIFLVTLPFAFVGEFVVDKLDFLKLLGLNKKYQKLEIFLEFLIFGVLLGVVEDLTAFHFSISDTEINSLVIFTSFLIAIPFAFVSEVLIDRVDFSKTLRFKRLFWKSVNGLNKNIKSIKSC